VAVIDCPRSHCSGNAAYAVCSEGLFAGCACDQPKDLLEVDHVSCVGGPAGSKGATGSAGAAGSAGSAADGSSSDGPADLGDGPLFDVGDLGDCSGAIAKEIPASECGHCDGAHAYALCQGLFYSDCSCVLPPGYVLVDGGVLDGGPRDATTMDGTAMDATTKDAAAKEGSPLEGAAETGG
jgi:hypothetical protein